MSITSEYNEYSVSVSLISLQPGFDGRHIQLLMTPRPSLYIKIIYIYEYWQSMQPFGHLLPNCHKLHYELWPIDLCAFVHRSRNHNVLIYDTLYAPQHFSICCRLVLLPS